MEGRFSVRFNLSSNLHSSEIFKMSLFSKILSPENPVFATYVTCGSVLVLKTLLMAPLTGRQRMKYGVLPSPEDAVFLKGKTALPSHADVDRVRRAHLNDLENIPIFFFAGLAYLLTDPSPKTAINLFWLYTAARCVHTFVYAIYVVPQPARAISWAVGYFITGYMAVKSIYHFWVLSCPLSGGFPQIPSA